MINKDDITITKIQWKNKEKKILNIQYCIKNKEDSLDISIDKETRKVTILSDGLIVGLPEEASKTIILMIIDKAFEVIHSNE